MHYIYLRFSYLLAYPVIKCQRIVAVKTRLISYNLFNVKPYMKHTLKMNKKEQTEKTQSY